MIVLPRTCFDVIATSARSAYPRECCGLLVGRGDPASRLDVLRVVASPNLAPGSGRDRFEVDPKVRFDLMKELGDGPDRMVGHYHSHPDAPAVPSATDLEMAFEPDLVWIIVSVFDGRPREARAHRLNSDGSGFLEVPLQTSENSRN